MPFLTDGPYLRFHRKVGETLGHLVADSCIDSMQQRGCLSEPVGMLC